MFNKKNNIVLDDRWKCFFKMNMSSSLTLTPSVILPMSDKALSREVLSGKMEKLQKHIARLEKQAHSCQGGSRRRSRRVSLSQQISVAKGRFALLQKASDMVSKETRKFHTLLSKPPLLSPTGLAISCYGSQVIPNGKDLFEPHLNNQMYPLRLIDPRRNLFRIVNLERRCTNETERKIHSVSIFSFSLIKSMFRYF